MGVDTNVPWRRFATSVRQARAAVERAEALLHGSPSASQHTCPERELLASIDREVQRRRHIWLEVSSRAQGLECESGRSVELRAELGEICRTLVVNVNQVVCLLMPGRKRQLRSAPGPASKLARTWLSSRAVLHETSMVLSSPIPDLSQAFTAAIGAARAWRAACRAHVEEFPGANLEASAKARVPAKPAAETCAAVAAWSSRVRRMLCEGDGNWLASAARLHKQAATRLAGNILYERRLAHRAGDLAKWTALYSGPRTLSYPAAMEAPTATSPAAKLAASTAVLERKYGTCTWDIEASALFRSYRDDAGRLRGALMDVQEVPVEFREAAKAARIGGISESLYGDLSRPLDQTERESLWSSFSDSAPGRSQFKLSVAGLLGGAVQDAVVAVVEALLRLGLAPCWLKCAILTWTEKANGGVRGLSLLEELLKAPDAIMTQRVESAIRCQPLGAVLTCSNVGYQRGRSPKLVLDAVMDFYEELWSDSSRCLTHVPWDFRSFFDEAHPCVADAVMKARGVPEVGRRWFVEVHSAEASLCAFTPWGLTPPVQRAIGLHQGSTSGPLLSRFVGEIPARLVDKHPSPAFIGAVPTAQLSMADDGNAFCEGVGAGQLAADALSLGCVSCGLGVDVKQGGAYTNGPTGALHVSHIGPQGSVLHDTFPLQKLQSPMRLLGVSSTWGAGPAASVEDLDREVRRQIGLARSRRSDVFELSTAISMYVLSHLVYAPDAQRVPIALAASWDDKIIDVARKALGVHPSTSPDLFFGHPDAGGMGYPSCVSWVLACRARELLVSFEGAEHQAAVRRGRWEALQRAQTRGVAQPCSSLKASVDFLASKGFYLRDARELFESRVLARLASRDRGWGQVERSSVPSTDAARASYSSLSPLASLIRNGLARHPTMWEATSEFWWSDQRFSWSGCRCGPEEVALAVAEAHTEARADWHSERTIFGSRRSCPREVGRPWWEQENWTGDTVESCPRSEALADVARMPQQCVWSATDGGAQDDAATVSVAFADVPLPVHLDEAIPRPPAFLRHTARLPLRIGTRLCGVHEGELAAVLASASRAPQAPCQSVVDRDALISLVDQLPSRTSRETIRGNCPPWETRLRSLLHLRELAIDPVFPVQTAPRPSDVNAWRASSSYRCTQLVWAPSHQPEGDAPRVPNEFCASLNHWADTGAAEAVARTLPEQISKPAGGTRFFFEHMCRTVIGDPALHIRLWYAAAATDHLESLPTAGLAARKSGIWWDRDLGSWRAVAVPSPLHALASELAPSWVPGRYLDMHKWVFRIRHGLSGCYTSLCKRVRLYKRISCAIADDNDLEGLLCPLCGQAAGDRWHVFWQCELAEPGMQECSTVLRDSLLAYAEQTLRN